MRKFQITELETQAAALVPGEIIWLQGVAHPLGATPGLPAGSPAQSTYVALLDEPPCCLPCLPRDPARRVEVIAETAIPITGVPICLQGELHILRDDPAGWRYQLRRARPAGPEHRPTRHLLTRRRILATAPLACVAVAAQASCASPLDPQQETAARAVIADAVTVDIHSHAGRVSGVQHVTEHEPFRPVAAPMRDGLMAAVCLAAVSDSPTHRVMPDRRIHPFRDPAPGELYAYGQAAFARIHDLIRAQDLAIVATAADLQAARGARPAIVVSAEGGDFLEGQPDRVDEAYARWTLRHLQLTHYRVNELGDIQTETPVHGGLTSIGADVIRRCNRLGLVVDVAHGTYELVKAAATVTSKPLVLSHTSLSTLPEPRPFSRVISPDHARIIAGTGGMIGIWPPASIFPDLAALAAGMARMVDVVGVDHVGLGTDMGGLVGPASFNSYRNLPGLAAALLDRGFSPDDTRKLLGGNYLRVFTASLA